MLSNGKKVIGLCMAGVDEEYNGLFLNAYAKYISAYDFKLITFYSLSTLDEVSRNDIGEANIFKLINYNILDGLIVMSETIKSEEVLYGLVSTALSKDIPVVSVDKYVENCYNISFNYDKAMEDMTRHLIEVHHYKVFNFMAGIKDNEFSDRRLNIFKSVLREYNIELDERRLGYGDFWSKPTKIAIDKFLATGLPLPDVFVCANDTMATTVFDELTDLGIRVPEDVAVTGFDGISFALNHQPVITTAAHDIDKTAIETYEIFSGIFEGKKTSKRKWVDSHIIIGGTCGCPSKQSRYTTNKLIQKLCDKMNENTFIQQRLAKMVNDLTDNRSFIEIFEELKRFVDLFDSDLFMICIDDVFLLEEEISDIMNENITKSINKNKEIYSPRMDLMVYKEDGKWKGITDFNTEILLPDLEEILENRDALVMFPMHVQDKTIGYAALDCRNYINFNLLYEFFMNLSTSLELTKSRVLQRKFIDSLEDKYVRDPLTNMFNRRGFYQEIGDEYERCMAECKEYVIVSADLNRLKVINDTYGHADGDMAITEAANALVKSTRHGEICSRFGGDEFIIAGPLVEENFEEKYRERVKEMLDDYNSQSGKPYEVTVSIGVNIFVPVEEVTIDKRISEADELMYREKVKAHMNRVN